MGLADADVDVAVMVPGQSAVPVLQRIAKELPQFGFEVKQEIYRARVPVLRVRELRTTAQTEFGISVNNLLPVYNTWLVKAYMDLDQRAVDLVKNVDSA